MFVSTSDKKYALFSGGMGTGLENRQSAMETYDSSLTKTLGPSLNSFRWNGISSPTVCSIMNKAGNYIVIAGGESFEANDISGVKCTTSEAYQYVS
jgi:hypothetical protein